MRTKTRVAGGAHSAPYELKAFKVDGNVRTHGEALSSVGYLNGGKA
ncbi:MAG TPA: hypothetical protein VLG17_03305 [Pseudomonas sp.]|nr:hypothetical protein [Pseudomonas sp.]HSX87011.1 hypothetical protein [Pseudomonas sp.]